MKSRSKSDPLPSEKPTFPLNSRQQQAVDHNDGPVLVIAGAGTGKTTVLTRRIVRLIQTGMALPHQILAVTYSNPAAAEMRKRVRKALGSEDDAGAVQIRTFHDYGRNVLDRNGKTFQLIEDVDLRIYLRRRVQELNLKHFIGPEDLGKFLGDLMEFIRRCQDELRSPGDYAQYVAQMAEGAVPMQRTAKKKKAEELSPEEKLERCQEVAHVFRKVEQYLREEGWGMFGHMISGCLDLLQSDAAVLAVEQARAKFILADEFQDANYAQVLLLKLLAGDQGNIFAVGDPDQSIYKFRGASSEAFDMFRREFPQTRVIHLDQNQRSRTPILQCAHRLIASNPDVFSGEASGLYERTPLQSARDNRAQQEGTSVRAVALVNLVTFRDEMDEARDTVRRIQEWHQDGRCDYRDFAVLYRSHRNRDRVIAELEQENIPFVVSGQDILQTTDVRDLLAAAAAVMSPVAITTVLRVAALPGFGIAGEELQAALATSRDSTFQMVLAKVSGGAQLLAALERARVRVQQHPSASRALRTITECLGMKLGKAGRSFLRFAWEWQRKPLAGEGTLTDFLSYMDEFAEAGGEIPLVRVDGEADANQTSPSDESPNAVQVMTAHASKGLEFRHVFVLRAHSSSFPSNYREPAVEFPVALSREESAKTTEAKELHAQEERRLFYVAMTRARDTLTIYGKPAGAPEPAAKFPREIHEADADGEYHRLRHPDLGRLSIFAQAGSSGAEQEPPTLHQWMELPPYRAANLQLSASALERYERCPLQFKLSRDWRLPAEPSAALQYGASMHRVLLHYYQSLQAGRPLALPALLQFFRDDLKKAGLEEDYQRALYEARGCRDLEAFVKAAESRPLPEVLHLEASVKFQLEGVTINGRLDRVDRLPDGRVRIVDYKTGKPKTQEIAASSLQLALYALAAASEWKYTVAESVFHNLQDGSLLPVSYSESDLDEVRARVQKAADGIRAGQFTAKVKSQVCAYCDFYGVCPQTEHRVYGLVEILPLDEAAREGDAE